MGGEDRQPVDHRSPRFGRSQGRRQFDRLPRGLPGGAGGRHQGRGRLGHQNHPRRTRTRRDYHGQGGRRVVKGGSTIDEEEKTPTGSYDQSPSFRANSSSRRVYLKNANRAALLSTK